MVRLRKAKKDDGPFIMDLLKTVLSDYGLKTNPEETDLDIADITSSYFGSKGWFAVLEDNGKIIGSYGLFRISDHTCELRKMYLFREYQGKGFGRLMMEDALDKAKELGFEEITLETNLLLESAMILYKKYGFQPYQPGHLSDRCDFAMKRKI